MRIRMMAVLAAGVLAGAAVAAQAPAASVRVEVRADDVPLAAASVTIGEATGISDASGQVTLAVLAGNIRLVVSKPGFLESTSDVTAPAGGQVTVAVTLVRQPVVTEDVIVVASTRTGRRLEDQPTRVEVLDREEIEEKMLMTPGDIVMMLNEMGGLRVQATSPSIGAASVRVQGMRGRYTRFLSDGLPLFGQQMGGLGLLQIPPMDLGQVEVIKGMASALYGAGAMGGVVNLLSRRPTPEVTADVLLNRSSLGATDVVTFVSAPIGAGWSGTLLGGGHWQTANDLDEDGWADVAGYSRGVVRPRLFWDGGNGRSAFVTAGVTVEDRAGGTMAGRTLAASGLPYVESLETQRYDVGGTMQTLVRDRYVFVARGAAAWQRHDHRFGGVAERDGHDTVFGEGSLRGVAGRHTWVAGLAYERDAFRPTDLPQFAYTFNAPGAFVQDDIDLATWFSVSASGRLDLHSEYGAFFSPRVAALVRGGDWTSRVSVGQGFFAPSPLTEETEAAGLSRLQIQQPLKAERGRGFSADLSRAIGPSSYTVTVFATKVTDPVVVERSAAYSLANATAASTNTGVELLATMRAAPFVATATYAYVRSREESDRQLQDAELTPRHSAGVVGMWEPEGAGRVGVEVYYTGRQRLEENVFRDVSRAYLIVGALVERQWGRWRLFFNAENLTDVRQTRWDPLVRPTRGVDGRWTVDAWAPLDGRVFNGGLRLSF